jgi:hypothetical protein
MELLVLHYTTTSQTVTVPAGATGTVSVPTTDDIAEPMRTFTIASGTAGYWNNDNDAAPTVATITAWATEGSPAVFEFSLSNPSAVDTTLSLHSPMELLEVLITLPLRKQ